MPLHTRFRDWIQREIMEELRNMGNTLASILAKEQATAVEVTQIKTIVSGLASDNASQKDLIAQLKQLLADAGIDQTLIDQIAGLQASSEATLAGIIAAQSSTGSSGSDSSGSGSSGDTSGTGGDSTGGDTPVPPVDTTQTAISTGPDGSEPTTGGTPTTDPSATSVEGTETAGG